MSFKWVSVASWGRGDSLPYFTDEAIASFRGWSQSHKAGPKPHCVPEPVLFNHCAPSSCLHCPLPPDPASYLLTVLIPSCFFAASVAACCPPVSWILHLLWHGHFLSSLLMLFSILWSQHPHWALGKINPPPCLPFRLSSWLTSSGKTMPQPPFDPKSSWNWVRLPGCGALPLSSVFRQAGWLSTIETLCSDFFFRASLFNLVPRTWLGPSGKLKRWGYFSLRGLSLAQSPCCASLSCSLSSILGSKPDHPFMAQVSERQRPRGGKSLLYLHDRYTSCSHVLLLGKMGQYTWGLSSCFILCPSHRCSVITLYMVTHQELVTWDHKTYSAGGRNLFLCLC